MDICVLYGPLISFVVDLLKRIPFIAKYPKVVSAVLALGVAIFNPTGNIAAIVECFIATFAASVAFHEVGKRTPVLDSLKDMLSGNKDHELFER